MRVLLLGIILLAFSPSTLCAQTFKPDPQQQTGYATYYADKYHGRTTAYGETYHRNLFTCASQDFPKNSLLRVTRIDNGQQVVVRVNDRGPWGNKENVIDLSYAAALQLDMIRAGSVKVKVEKIGSSGSNPAPTNYASQTSGSTPRRKRANTQTTAANNEAIIRKNIPVQAYSAPPAPQTPSTPEGVSWLSGPQEAYGVQIAAYTQSDNALRQAEKWAAAGVQNLYLWQESPNQIKVIVGKYASRQQADSQLSILRSQFNLDGFVKFF